MPSSWCATGARPGRSRGWRWRCRTPRSHAVSSARRRRSHGDAGDDDAVLLYGHLDKQPPMDGWLDGLGPLTPVRRGDRLYGRGGGDDGYAAFAALAAIEARPAARRPPRPLRRC